MEANRDVSVESAIESSLGSSKNENKEDIEADTSENTRTSLTSPKPRETIRMLGPEACGLVIEAYSETDHSWFEIKVDPNASENTRTSLILEKHYESVRMLGQGACGLVIEARSRTDGCCYAIKIISLPLDEESKEKVMREVRKLAQLDNPGIVRYFNSWMDRFPFGLTFTSDHRVLPIDSDDSFVKFEKTSSTSEPSSSDLLSMESSESLTNEWVKSNFKHGGMCLYIQMQLCEKDTLEIWLSKNQERDTQYMMNKFAQITKAVNYLHKEKELIHRDLKPANIYFTENCCLKIGDFGFVTDIHTNSFCGVISDDASGGGHSYTKDQGSYLYMAPEILSGGRYSEKVDIFALGIIFFELLYWFATKTERYKVLESLKERKFPTDFREQHPRECELLESMLSPNYEERPTAEEILNHKIFKSNNLN